MKNVTFVALLLIAITHSSMALANNSDKTGAQLNITQSTTDQKKAIIRVANLVEGQKSFLKIKDKKGRLLHAETIHGQPSFVRTYDFSGLAGEEYIVQVRTKEGVTSQRFSVKAEQDEAVYFKPVVRAEPGMIKVIFKNPMNSPMKLNLYDKNGQLIYNTNVASQEVFATGLDVSHLQHKQYSLSLQGENYAYSKNISTR
ncbi:hypothetical protein [Catalinimonas niigatensis]|uniref:hypothetical protein n=1 Tax=Catalinimonas niigatensis TaxID=1397264 RepID=UPI002665AF72|nr:hypothetical protein [Catalinimonas niigatensis]WPP48461.1 hypothetical protein PZB72_17450 [Catalinimonas niigatensis]